ncbi:MAG: hypothetical protein AAF500_14600 [Myxococcota bacterium]
MCDVIRGRMSRCFCTVVLAMSLASCSDTVPSTGGSGGSDATGGAGAAGTGGTGGTSGTGGTAETGGVGGEEPPPPPRPTGVVVGFGGARLKSVQYEMDVAVGGPVGKGRATSPQYMLDYYTPTSPER